MDTIDNINIRYGASLKLTATLDSDMVGLTSLTFFISIEGDVLPILSIPAVINGNEAIVYEQELKLPLGEYKYQYTAVYNDGFIEKYPSPDECCGGDCELPTLTVLESLDIVEIS